jgi:predicted PurR-regulated permease PerM
MHIRGATHSDELSEPVDHTERPDRAQIWAVVRRAGAGLIVLIAAVVLALNRPFARGALLIGLLSVTFAYLIAPLIFRVRLRYQSGNRRFSTTLSVLLVYLVLAAIGVATWALTSQRLQKQFADLRAETPVYLERAKQRLEMAEQIADRFSPPAPYGAYIRALLRTASLSIREQAARVVADVVASRSLLPWLCLVPALALLLISRFSWFRDSAVAHLPEGHLRWRGEEFFRHVNCILAGYMRAQILACLVVGTASIAGFWLIGMPHALLLGTISGVLEFLPAVGPLAVGVVACSIVDGDRLLLLLGFLVALRLVQDYLIYPMLIGHGMHMHPAAIILAVLAGAQAGGMLGILAAIPFVGIASVAVRHWREYWAIERLLKEHGRRVAVSDRTIPHPDPPDRTSDSVVPPGPGIQESQTTAQSKPW